jgi:transcription initiation factor TFIID subunit TAF12
MDLLHIHLNELLDTITQVHTQQQKKYLQHLQHLQQQQKIQNQQPQQQQNSNQTNNPTPNLQPANNVNITSLNILNSTPNPNIGVCQNLISTSITNSGLIAATIPSALLSNAVNTNNINPSSNTALTNTNSPLIPNANKNNESLLANNLNLNNLLNSYINQQQEQHQLITKLEELINTLIQVS